MGFGGELMMRWNSIRETLIYENNTSHSFSNMEKI